MAITSSPPHIAIIAFRGVSLFHLGVPLAVFAENREKLGIPNFKVSICATDANVIDTSNGLKLLTNEGLECLKDADVIIIPTWHYELTPVPKHLIKVIQTAHQQGKLLVGLCLGSFVLAAAGLLSDKKIATHWAWIELFKKRYPDIKIDPNVLYIDEGQIITSAGMAAALDCCLYLLRRLSGAEVANKVAKQLVTAPHRQGGQV